MTPVGIARVRACFENAEEIFPARGPHSEERNRPTAQAICLPQMPQMPQLPQQQAPACKILTDREDAFEERAAIIEYDGGLPRPLSEFFAGRRRDQSGVSMPIDISASKPFFDMLLLQFAEIGQA